MPQELQKPDRLKKLEYMAEMGLVMTYEERIELENLQSDFAAQIANPDTDEVVHEYAPEQIAMSYEPKPLTVEELAAFDAYQRQIGGKRRRKSVWLRFIDWLLGDRT